MEEGNIQQQPAEMALGSHFAPVNVHHVRKQLERVKANANGQGDFGNHTGETKPLLGVLQHEYSVFEKGQKSQVNNATQGKKEFAFPSTSIFVNKLRKYPVGKTHK